MSRNKTVEYRSEEQMSRSDLAAFLRRLADRVETGTVTLKRDGDDTTVQLPERLELELTYAVKSKPKGNKHELEIEVEWDEGSGGVGLA